MYYIVDVQGFVRLGEEFVLKKFAMITVDGNRFDHLEFIVKPPCPFENLSEKYRIINSWFERNFHGITWDSGTIIYGEAMMHICQILHDARVIYVWGLEKKKWLNGVLGSSVVIYDLREHNCPSMMKLKLLFDYRSEENKFSKEFACAGENVVLMKLWMLRNNVFL